MLISSVDPASFLHNVLLIDPARWCAGSFIYLPSPCSFPVAVSIYQGYNDYRRSRSGG